MKRSKNKHVGEKYSGYSFATAASKIGKKYPDRDFNSIQQNSFLREVSALIELQNVARSKQVAMDTIKDNRKPTNPSEYGFGTPPFGLDPTTMKKAFGYPTTTPGQFDNILTPDMSRNAFDSSMVPATPYGAPSPTIASRANANIANVTKNFGANFQLPESPLAPMMEEGASTGGTDPKSNFLKDNIYAPLAIGKGVEFLGKAAMTLSGASKVSPEFNPYETQIRGMMQERSFNNDFARNAILSQQNAAKANVAGIANPAVAQALLQNTYSQGMTALARNEADMQQGRNALAGDTAQTLNNLGQQRVGARNYAENLNEQGLATQQMSLQNLLSTVGGAGQKLTDYRAGIAQQSLLASALSTNDFQFGDVASIIKDAVSMRRINPDDAIQIIQGSKGKDKAAVLSEVEAAVNKFRQSF